MNGWHQDLVFDRFEQFIGDNRCRRISTHAACVGAFVSIVSRFVILRRRQGKDRLSVGNRKHARFGALESLFDNHLSARTSELVLAPDSIDRFQCLIAIRTNDHSFAAR